ncbi:DEK domain-containing chromatin-associated protein 1-like isoform X2 [Rhodamnia argentea]|uniref:DEK domain-containing chromatin-associated protein 1-like isoform X2 n=1 Tax=Rhodamnia argentea TaxID=178133 RepID=A0A8B8Q5B7_9MYRT|nr:DEK domain-containing chromatin-associated protein 1-like isoform X2 [Rhodamnia argentea]
MASEALETAEPEGAAPVEGKDQLSEKLDEEPKVEEEAEQKDQEIPPEAPEASDEKTADEDGDDAQEVKESEESPKGSSEPKKKSKKDSATPGIERPARERRSVERYSAPALVRTPSSKGLSIGKGSGTQLKDIPNVAFKLSKRKPDDNLQILHSILFGKKAKQSKLSSKFLKLFFQDNLKADISLGYVHSLKRNIGQFSGYVWTENQLEKQRAKVKEKLEKCVKDKLIDFCDVLNIPINKAAVKKEELSAKLLEFLESPHSTTDVLLADKEQGQKRKRRIAPSKTLVPGEASSTMTEKKQKQAPDSEKKSLEVSSEEDGDDKGDNKQVKDGSDANSDDDMVSKEESGDEKSKSEEDDTLKEPVSKSSSRKKSKDSSVSKTKDTSESAKMVTPAKSAKKLSASASKKSTVDGVGSKKSLPKSEGSMSKKQKVEKSNQNNQSVSSKAKTLSKKQSTKPSTEASVKDRGKGKSSKKPKAEPGREEMHAVVVDILKKVDFNTATLSDILRQLGTHFGVDLMHRKAEIKDVITEVINNMTDDEDEGDDDEEAEDKADADDNE